MKATLTPSKIIVLIGTVSTFLICSFQPATKTLDYKDFTIEVPSHWEKVKVQGIDSYVGRFSISANEYAGFDLGRYSSKLEGEDQIYEFTTISNKKAKIVRPKVSGKGLTGVYIDSIGNTPYGRIRFQLNGRNLTAANEELLLTAIKTIKFANTSN
ncbi:hypothetical protein [Pedobacter sp. GR22-6]|uniref:hypothetical protein n=1 Tax=Pedobacter sp. GR22-6 TaxID=3127957 RepID=UPI00307E6043